LVAARVCLCARSHNVGVGAGRKSRNLGSGRSREAETMIKREAGPSRRSKPAAIIVRLGKKALKARNTDDADCRRKRHERGPHERRRQ
jgi:hypothetical protein